VSNGCIAYTQDIDQVGNYFTSKADLGNPAVHALNGKLFQLSHIVEIPAESDYWYSFYVPTTGGKDIILFNRDWAAQQGVHEIYTWTAMTSYTQGAPIFQLNARVALGFGVTQWTAGVTDVVGGFGVLPDALLGSHKGDSYGDAGGVVVVDRGSEGLIKVTNTGNQASIFRAYFIFAEIDLTGAVDPDPGFFLP
jgi:hypothetical protein